MKTGLLQKFKEAMLSREVRKVMPTDMSSAEIEQLGAEILERSIISAKTLSTTYLEAMEKNVRDILNPRTGTRVNQEGQSEVFTEGTNKAGARLELKKVWEALGYEPPAGKEGTIEDLSSDARIDLVLETNVDLARGFGQWRQGQDEAVLDLWPCQELFRAEERVKKRDWVSRWKQAAAICGDYDALKALSAAGRMIARKDSPIWEALGEAGPFKHPYPPFDWRSGMWVRDVDRETSVGFGIVGEWDVIVPQRRSFELEQAA